MITNINGCEQQHFAPQSLDGIGGSLMQREYSCSYSSETLVCSPQSLSYSYQSLSYSSNTVIESDRVSLSDSGSISSLHLFFNRIRTAIGDALDMERKGDYGGYDGMDTPAGVAGRLLGRIETVLFGSQTSPGPDSVEETVLEPETAAMADAISEEMPVDEVGNKVENPDTPGAVIAGATAEVPAPEEAPGSYVGTGPEEGEAEPVVETELTAAPAVETGPDSAQAPVPDEEEGSDVETKRAELLKFVEEKIDVSFRETLFEISGKNERAGKRHRFGQEYPQQDVKGVDETYALIKGGVNALRHRGAEPNYSGNRISMVSAGYREERTVKLEIMTREGDAVNIEIGKSLALGITRFQAEGRDVSVKAGEQFGNLNEHLEFSVKGDLDDGELEAIAQFLKDVGSLAEAFFASDSQDAVAQAIQLAFDDEELAGFSLDMTRERTSYATVLLQNGVGTARQDRGGNRTMNDPHDQDRVRGLAGKIRRVFKHPVLDTFERPGAVIGKLLHVLAEERRASGADEAPGVTEKKPARFINDFVSRLMNGRFPEKGGERQIHGASGERGRVFNDYSA